MEWNVYSNLKKNGKKIVGNISRSTCLTDFGISSVRTKFSFFSGHKRSSVVTFPEQLFFVLKALFIGEVRHFLRSYFKICNQVGMSWSVESIPYLTLSMNCVQR